MVNKKILLSVCVCVCVCVSEKVFYYVQYSCNLDMDFGASLKPLLPAAVSGLIYRKILGYTSRATDLISHLYILSLILSVFLAHTCPVLDSLLQPPITVAFIWIS